MQRRPPVWSDKLPLEWTNHIIERLAKLGIKQEVYQGRTIKERLMDSMAVPNILALVEHARKDDKNRDVWKRLVIHRTTPNRWMNNEQQPHAREFFGLLVIGLRQELSGITLPTIRRVMWEGVSRTVAIISVKECEQARRELTWEEFVCARQFLRHPHSISLLGDVSRSTVDDIVQDVAFELRRLFPRAGPSWTCSTVLTAIDDWAFPYAFFRFGLAEAWKFLDEEAFRQVL